MSRSNAPTRPEAAPARHTGRRRAGSGWRVPKWAALVGLAVALVAVGVLVFYPRGSSQSGQGGGPPSGDAPLTELWPTAKVVKQSGRLPDGRAYTPMFYVDAETSVGTALTDDGGAIRLMVRVADGSAKELWRVPSTGNPQFDAFTQAGDDILFMVSDGADEPKSTLYRANWRQAGTAVALTADTGDVVNYNSQYDLVVADGIVHWVSAVSDQEVTEVRSVPVAGGTVSVQKVDGTYTLTAWPWLTSAGTSPSGPVELRNLTTGQKISVATQPTEVVNCGPVWCRILVVGQAGEPLRTDLVHPDGSGRVTIAPATASAAVLDVALLDRFEVLSITDPNSDSDSLRLVLYDAKSNRSASLADGISTIQARGPVLWWSTGDNESTEWYSLDLRTLS